MQRTTDTIFLWWLRLQPEMLLFLVNRHLVLDWTGWLDWNSVHQSDTTATLTPQIVWMVAELGRLWGFFFRKRRFPSDAPLLKVRTAVAESRGLHSCRAGSRFSGWLSVGVGRPTVWHIQGLCPAVAARRWLTVHDEARVSKSLQISHIFMKPKTFRGFHKTSAYVHHFHFLLTLNFSIWTEK